MNTDEDLAAVREFRAALDEPRDGALAKGRWQLAGGGGPERPGARKSWVLATAGAALAVAVVVGGAATINRAPKPQPPDQTVAAPPSATRPQATDLPVTHGTKAPMNPAVTGKAGGSHVQAVEALTRLAAEQTDGPLTIGADQAMYVKTYSLTDGDTRYIHEVWMDVTIGAPLRIRRHDDLPKTIDHSLSPAEIDASAAAAQGRPPGLDNMNGAYVTAFPSGAGQAHALAASWKDWAQQEYPGRGADGLIFKQLHEVFHYVDPLLTAAQRSALYLALAELPSVKATTATIAGKQYDVVCVSNQDQGTQCALFDPATGRFVGDAQTLPDMVVKAGGFTFVDVAVQPRPAAGPDVVATQKK